MAWEKLTEARLEEVLTAYKADIPLGMIREENDFRISVAGAQEKTALLRIGNDWCIPKGITPTTHIIKLPIGEIPAALDNVKTSLPTDFPENVVTAVETNVLRLHGRLSREYGSK
ncbi:type II toxin-antitoxin system HipA family toxin [Escherichia coli]|nr:type II toxin-antitoxin system HipA family toxin [Escherichia coli]